MTIHSQPILWQKIPHTSSTDRGPWTNTSCPSKTGDTTDKLDTEWMLSMALSNSCTSFITTLCVIRNKRVREKKGENSEGDQCGRTIKWIKIWPHIQRLTRHMHTLTHIHTHTHTWQGDHIRVLHIPAMPPTPIHGTLAQPYWEYIQYHMLKVWP